MPVFRHVRLHVAHLDRAGVRAQQDVLGDLAVLVEEVKGIVHRTRRVILGRVQGSEILEVGLDFRAVGDFKADGMEQRFDALQRARHRMQATTGLATSGQGEIDRLFGQTCFQCLTAERLATAVERAFDGFLGTVDGGTSEFSLIR